MPAGQHLGGLLLLPTVPSGVAARPSTRWTLSLLKWRSRSSRLTHFVSMSAGFWSPCTLNMVKSQRRSPSWTHNWPTARCLTRPMPLLRQIPIAAAESACMRTFMLRPRSNPQDWMPSASVVHFTRPYNSASAELKVTARWVDDQCFIRWVPRRATPPDVLRRVAMHPAKSVSTKTSRSLSGCQA